MEDLATTAQMLDQLRKLAAAVRPRLAQHAEHWASLDAAAGSMHAVEMLAADAHLTVTACMAIANSLPPLSATERRFLQVQ